MSDHKLPKTAEQIDAAARRVAEKELQAKLDADKAALRADFPDHFFADFKFDTGEKMRIIVPNTFNSDQFETAIGLLTQLRYAAEQKKKAEQTIIPIERPKLQSVDGKPLS